MILKRLKTLLNKLTSKRLNFMTIVGDSGQGEIKLIPVYTDVGFCFLSSDAVTEVKVDPQYMVTARRMLNNTVEETLNEPVVVYDGVVKNKVIGIKTNQHKLVLTYSHD